MDTHTDEHDLAKVLDSVTAELNTAAPTTPAPGTQGFEESTAQPGSEPVVLPGSPIAPVASDPPHVSTLPVPSDPPVAAPSVDSTSAGPLDAIKQDALVELRPLVDKLTVSAEEKFDTYLLLIRSTDDAALIAPAHEAAKAISDDARRAEALLDIIKEIDYLNNQKKA